MGSNTSRQSDTAPVRLRDFPEFPLMAYYRFKNRNRGSCTPDAVELHKERNAAMPQLLPSPRYQVSLDHVPIVDETVPFLSKLPLEIRRQIYTYALGGNLVHLLLVRHKMSHFCCEYSAVAHPERTCCPFAEPLMEPASIPLPPSSISDSINLLRTNRQIYAETLPVLYSTNVIDTNDLSAFNVFANNIPLAGLSLIKSLHLNWYTEYPPLQYEITQDPVSAPYDDATYQRFWDTVALQMPGLRELRLYIATTWFIRNPVDDLALPWTQPIQRLRNLRVFDFSFVEDVSRMESRVDQVQEFTDKLGAIICNNNAEIRARLIHKS
ncbi:MAG: hypothetical protein M1836_003739 [Candelina mexicana]|nr:MAG: hypothetical protein M1836_003739 [Candelina mexicana]